MSVIYTGDNIQWDIIAFVALVQDNAVKNDVALRPLGELHQVLFGNIKNFQLLDEANHIGESCLVFGLLLLLQHGRQQQGDIFLPPIL